MQEEQVIREPNKLEKESSVAKSMAFVQQYFQVRDPLNKYPQDKQQQFKRQYETLNPHQRYNCCELLLSNAWNYIDERKYIEAQKQFCFVIPLCYEAKLKFEEFQIQKLIWQCFVNNPKLEETERSDNEKMLEECGFKFTKFRRERAARPKKKSAFDSFIDKITCRSCFSRKPKSSIEY